MPVEHRGELGYGDVYTWTAICADTKLVPCWLVGDRSYNTAKIFIADLASRLINRVQLTTDQHNAYLEAVEKSFGGDIDYARLYKIYGLDTRGDGPRKYSPAKCLGVQTKVAEGSSDPKHILTSYDERQNLTMRMQMRRFTRLTNAFSKKVEDLAHAVSLHFMYYNFCRIHQSRRVTPAMEAGKAEHPWSLEDIVMLNQK